MTLSQFIDYVRNRHRAVGDTNWSDDEIYACLTSRCNEVLSIIGLIEATDTSNTSVATTQAYTIPTDCVRIKQVLYDGKGIEQVTFEEWESQKNTSGTTPAGTPYNYVLWNRELLLIPIPDTAGDTITIYYEKNHPFIDGSTQTTIDIHASLHLRLADGVLADMFAKDLNFEGAGFYETKWNQAHIPAFEKYKRKQSRGDRFFTVRDIDSQPRKRGLN